jgi:hypothetical protein
VCRVWPHRAAGKDGTAPPRPGWSQAAGSAHVGPFRGPGKDVVPMLAASVWPQVEAGRFIRSDIVTEWVKNQTRALRQRWPQSGNPLRGSSN